MTSADLCPALPAHKNTRHQLSISNGWSAGGTGLPEVWCGFCKNHFAGDDEWAARYLAAEEKRVRQNIGKPRPYGVSERRAQEIMQEALAEFQRRGLLLA